MACRIEDYAVLGDQRTAALVGVHGSIDWLCLPRFDSTACFAALLGTPDHGRWLLVPDVPYDVTRRYRPGTFVLETTYTTEDGSVRVVDAMPTGDDRADIVRRVEGLRGSVRMRHEWVVRFGYGAVCPWVHRIVDQHGHPALHAVAGPDMVVLRGTRLPTAAGRRHTDAFDVGAGEVVEWSTTWYHAWQEVPEAVDVGRALDRTTTEWQQWAAAAPEGGPYHDALTRSLLVLRLLTHSVTGGIVAAPTTSLPESFGGPRNWDYRFCWLRDASLTLEALIDCGYVDEARGWRRWLLRAVAGDPEDLQIMYGVDGGRGAAGAAAGPPAGLREQPAGPRGQRRSGTAADRRAGGGDARPVGCARRRAGGGRAVLGVAAAARQRPGQALAGRRQRHLGGAWRAPPLHPLARHGAGSPSTGRCGRSRTTAGTVRWSTGGPSATRCARRSCGEGFDEQLGTFVQYYGSRRTDASLLQIPIVGFLPPDDPRVIGTVAAIERELVHEGLLLRYRTEHGVDGLPPARSRSWRARSGWPRCTPWPAGSTTHA